MKDVLEKVHADVQERKRRLIQSVDRFAALPLEHKVLLATVPKCGTMLLRNILLHFVGVRISYMPFLDVEHLQIAGAASKIYRFFTGHMKGTPDAQAFFGHWRVILLVRHPYDFTLSYARFLYRPVVYERYELARHLQDRNVPLDECVRYFVYGGEYHGRYIASVREHFEQFALAWGTRPDAFVRYEDLKRYCANLDSGDAHDFFKRLLQAVGLDVPHDWKERVRAGSQHEISGTSSIGCPHHEVRELTDEQKALLDAEAPGLCEKLGYPGSPRVREAAA